MSIARNLKTAMDAQAVSVARLGADSGVDPVFLRKYLAGKSKPSDGVLERLARSLGVTPEEIKFGPQDRRIGKLTTAEVSRITGIDPLSLRVGLQRNVWPFGVAYKRNGSTQFTYEYFPEAVARFAAAKNAIRENLSPAGGGV